MKSRGNAMNVDAGAWRPDVVVSDRRGTTADPAFTAWTAQWFADAGYRVQINDPYRGGDLLTALADPARQRHSIRSSSIARCTWTRPHSRNTWASPR